MFHSRGNQGSQKDWCGAVQSPTAWRRCHLRGKRATLGGRWGEPWRQVRAGEGGVALERLPKQSAVPGTASILNNCIMWVALNNLQFQKQIRGRYKKKSKSHSEVRRDYTYHEPSMSSLLGLFLKQPWHWLKPEGLDQGVENVTCLGQHPNQYLLSNSYRLSKVT